MKPKKYIRKIADRIKSMSDKEKTIHIALICLVGVALVFASNFRGGTEEAKGTSEDESLQAETQVAQETPSQSISDYQSALQEDLKNILSKINGVGKVDVMITFDSAEKKEIAYNTQQSTNTTTENDTEGGKRVIEENQSDRDAIMVNKDGSNEPLVVTETYPNIKGVIVVAEGASDAEKKYELLKCVENVLDLPSHKIMIYERKK